MSYNMNIWSASRVSLTKSVNEAPRRWLCGDKKSDSQLKFSMQDAIELFNREYAILEHMQVRLTRKLMKLTAASEIKNN